MELGGEISERLESGVQLAKLAERREFLGSKAGGMLDQEMRVIVEEIPAPASGLARPPAFRRASFGAARVDLKLLPDRPDGLEKVHHLVVKEVEEAELMFQAFPAIEEGLLVEPRPIRHGHADKESAFLKEIQEAVHVALVVLGDDKEGHGEVVNRIGRDEDGSPTVMNLVDTEGAGEVCQCPLPVGSAVDLLVGPLEAVVDEADRDLKEEVLLEMALNLVDREVIADEEIHNFLTDGLGVAAPEGDAFDGRGEEFGARTGGGIHPDHEPPHDRLLVGEVLHLARSEALSSALFPAARARMLEWCPSSRLNNRGESPRQTISTHTSPSLVG